MTDKIGEHQLVRMEYYKRFVQEADRGLLTKSARMTLLNQDRLKSDKAKADFWYDQRVTVENGLTDLEMFLMFAGYKNVQKVFTIENVKPVINALLRTRLSEYERETALIAQHMIEAGFIHLTSIEPNLMTEAHEDIVRKAIDLSRRLAVNRIPDSERPFYSQKWPEGDKSD